MVTDEDYGGINLEDEQIKSYYDEEARRAKYDYNIGLRRTPLSNNLLLAVKSLIIPVTEGFDHINQDMSSSNLDQWDKIACENSSNIITFCKLHGIMKPYYLERSKLATKLNISLSKDGFWANIFTTSVTRQSQEFKDVTPKKTGFFSFGRSKDESHKGD